MSRQCVMKNRKILVVNQICIKVGKCKEESIQ